MEYTSSVLACKVAQITEALTRKGYSFEGTQVDYLLPDDGYLRVQFTRPLNTYFQDLLTIRLSFGTSYYGEVWSDLLAGEEKPRGLVPRTRFSGTRELLHILEYFEGQAGRYSEADPAEVPVNQELSLA